MGADGWTEAGPWHDDPNDSLRELQRRRLDQQYKFPRYLSDRLAGARAALSATVRGNDEPELKEQLIELFTSEAAYLESVLSGPFPSDLASRLITIRRINGADGCGGILDVVGVDEPGPFAVARVLRTGEIEAAFGTAKPTPADFRQHGARLPDVGRAECICFALFDEAGQPSGWQFVGRTFD